MKYIIHPEVRNDVKAEYLRLDIKHPTVDNKTKLRAALKLVRAIQLADTLSFNQEYMVTH